MCVCVCHTIFECGRLAAKPDVCGLQRSIGLHFAVLLAMTGQLQRNKLTECSNRRRTCGAYAFPFLTGACLATLTNHQ